MGKRRIWFTISAVVIAICISLITLQHKSNRPARASHAQSDGEADVLERGSSEPVSNAASTQTSVATSSPQFVVSTEDGRFKGPLRLLIVQHGEVVEELVAIVNGPPVSAGPSVRRGKIAVALAPAPEDPAFAATLRDRYVWPEQQVYQSRRAQDPTPIGIQLTMPQGDLGSLEVRVDRSDGRRVQHAELVLSTHAPAMRKRAVPFARMPVSSDHAATFEGLRPGLYHYLLERITPPAMPVRGTTGRVSIQAGRTSFVTVTLEPFGRIEGVVQLQESPAKGLVGVSLYRRIDGYWAGWASMPLDEQGRFKFDPLPVGEYLINCWPPGRSPTEAIVRVQPGEPAVAELKTTSKGVTVRGSLAHSNGTAAAAIRANLNRRLAGNQSTPCGRPLRVDSEGGFACRNTPPGDFLLILWDLGWAREIRLSDGQRNSEGVHELGRLRVPGSRGSARIRLAVEEPDGRPPRTTGVRIMLCSEDQDWGGWCRFEHSDGGGTVEFTDLAEGRYSVWAEPAARADWFKPTRELSIAAVKDLTQVATIRLSD